MSYPTIQKFGLDVLDVTSLTQTAVSTSRNPTNAANALSYASDDGSSFLTQTPPSPNVVDIDAIIDVDKEGWLFVPSAMEEKWAIFKDGSRILFIRSWQRLVYVIADGTKLYGTFAAPTETPEQTRAIYSFLMRSHVLGEDAPAPVDVLLEDTPDTAALVAFSMYGRRANYVVFV